MATEHKKLKPEEIIVDQRLQVRKALDAPTVERYAALIGDGEHLPWIDCGRLKDDGPIYLIDGFHRYAAYAQHPTRELDCLVKTFDSFDDMFEFALMCNMKHGLTLTEEERRDAIQKVIQRHPEESQRQLAWRCGCSKSVIGKYQNQLATRGQFERPEKVVGIDGKARPTTVTRKYEKPAIIAPPEPTEEDSNEPADYQPLADSASVTPRTVKCPCCGKTATILEANDHHSTWEPDSESFNLELGIYEKWYCSEDCMERYKRATNIKGFGVGEELPDYGEDDEDEEEEEAPEPETDQEDTIVTCQHCGKTTTLKDALDYQKSGWQPADVLSDVTQNWCCSEECLAAEMGEPAVKPEKKRRAEAKPEPEPEPEKEAPVDPAALHVPQCPFSKFHHPKLEKVSNNGYRVRCPECDKEGRIVRTYVEKSWRKAHQAWGRYDNETKTLEELLEESDY